MEWLLESLGLQSADISLDWHDSDELNVAASSFHARYARQPLDKLAEARSKHHEFMSEIDTYLRQKNICKRLEFTGSSYEGVKVAKDNEDPDIEFDVMVVLTEGHRLEEHETGDHKPGYSILKPRPGYTVSSQLKGMLSYTGVLGMLVTGDCCVDADKLRQLFCGEIQKCINGSTQMSGKAKLRYHGPAVQMDVHPNAGVLLWGPKLYSVDIVPAFDVNGRLYVAKPLKNEEMPYQAWRRSFSLDERRKLDSADQSNGCRKQVFRILKVLRNNEAGFSSLTSYHLKTALFMEMDKPGNMWTYRDVGRRLMGVLEQLECHLAAGYMPHYYLSTINLLENISSSCLSNMKDRIHRLRTNKNQMMKALKS